MGDSGSLFLGYMLAAFSLAGTTHTDPLLALLVPVVALGLPVLDTGLCMVRRLIDGISPFSPDSDHIHHRLRRFWSTRTAVLILYAVSLWFGIAAILISEFELIVGLLMVGVTMIAAYVGIRTLGYLNLRQIIIRKVKAEPQLALEFAQNGDHDGAEIFEKKELESVTPEVVVPFDLPYGGNGGSPTVHQPAYTLDGDQSLPAETNGHDSNGHRDGSPDRREAIRTSAEMESRDKLELIP